MSRPPSDELLKTIFVSGFSKSLPNQALEKALTIFPGFSKLQRPSLYDGSPSEFGFITFSTAAGVNQALRVFPQIKLDSNDKSLLATAEKATLEWLSKAPGTDPTIANDPNVIAKFSEDLKSFTSQNGHMDSSIKKSRIEEEGDVYEIIRRSQTGEDKTLEDIEIDEKDLPRIKEEIAQFREESLKFEKKRDQDALNYEKKTQGRTLNMSSFARTNTTKTNDEDKLIDVDIKYEDDEIPAGEDGDQLVLEMKEEKEARKIQNRFEEAERKWIQREEHRAKLQERNKDQTVGDLTEEEKKARIEKYRLFDENDPHTRRHMEYFTHHNQWEIARREFRKRETELDQRDAAEEENERTVESETAEEPDISGKISLSFKGSKKTNPSWAEPETKNPSSPKILPSGIEELAAHSIKWENVDETVLESIIRPAVVSDIVEYLGVEEEELIEFVVGHIREHKPLTELSTELEATLDEDAQVVAEHIWRLLVEATEAGEKEQEV